MVPDSLPNENLRDDDLCSPDRRPGSASVNPVRRRSMIPAYALENGAVGGYVGGDAGPGEHVDFSATALVTAAARCRETVHVLRSEPTGRIGVAFGDHVDARNGDYSCVASLPGVYPEWLGSSEFLETHGVRFPYTSGAMAHGI